VLSKFTCKGYGPELGMSNDANPLSSPTSGLGRNTKPS
jgi:hypothetical protein